MQILAEINVALHQAVERSVVDRAGFHANDTWLKKQFRATETFRATLMMLPSGCSENGQILQSILSRSNHLDLALKALVLHRGWSQRRRFLRRALQENLEQGRADCLRWRSSVMMRKWFPIDWLKSLDLLKPPLMDFVEVTFHVHTIVEFHVPSIYVSARGRR